MNSRRRIVCVLIVLGLATGFGVSSVRQSRNIARAGTGATHVPPYRPVPSTTPVTAAPRCVSLVRAHWSVVSAAQPRDGAGAQRLVKTRSRDSRPRSACFKGRPGAVLVRDE
jgi:hypothetical protein